MRGKGVGSERETCSARNKRELGFNNASQVGIYQHTIEKSTVNLICMICMMNHGRLELAGRQHRVVCLHMQHWLHRPQRRGVLAV